MESQPSRRSVTYCVVPRDLADTLHDVLRRHYASDAGVEVVVEQRERHRRTRADRRSGTGEEPLTGERRRIRAAEGRRVADRRALTVAVDAGELPRKARQHAGRLVFVERIEHPTLHTEDIDSRRLITAFHAGRQDAFSELYMRYFERVYNYMRVVVQDPHDAEEGTQQVFLKVFEALPRYEHRRQPFRAWLFVIARNQAISQLRGQGRLQPTDPALLDERRERTQAADVSPDALDSLDWITDRELLMFIERLPEPQRQVLLLRYMLDLSHAQIGEVLDRRPDDVRMLLSRAQRFLHDRLVGLGRHTEHSRPQPMVRRPAHYYLLRRRRYALMR